MRTILRLAGGLCVLTLAGLLPAVAQQPTVGLIHNSEFASEGYTLFSPQGSVTTYLINNGGLVVNSWESTVPPSLMGYLRENGNLVRAGKQAGNGAGLVEEFDWDGNLIWQFNYASDDFVSHHDIEPMPNGNVLLLAYEFKTSSEAIQAGRDPSMLGPELWPDHIVEVEPILPAGGTIVWEWHVWDHMIQDFDSSKDNHGVVADHPELIDINFTGGTTGADWNHLNGITYNADLDQIVVSSRMQSEIWIIDHSTTTAEATGHIGGNSGKGGDLLYRWGNPQGYGHGIEADRTLYRQHDATWIPAGYPGAGNILVFNNGKERPGSEYSSVDEFVPPVDQDGNYLMESGEAFAPLSATWSYFTNAADFYSPRISGAQRLPNGNTLIDDGVAGRLFEVQTDGTIVWEYQVPVNGDTPLAQGDPPTSSNLFKMRRYPPDYPAFVGRDITPGDPIELFTPPSPVPQGSLAASRASESRIDVTWDSSTCTSAGYDLIYGDLAGLPTYSLAGAECSIGLGGSFAWTGVPSGSLYFLIVGREPSGIYESGWGVDSAGSPRLAHRAAGLCGSTIKATATTCP